MNHRILCQRRERKKERERERGGRNVKILAFICTEGFIGPI